MRPRLHPLWLTLLAACADEVPPAPEIAAVTPALGRAGEPTLLRVEGRFSIARVEVDYGAGTATPVASAQLWLSDLQLQGVRGLEEGALEGTAPATLSAGFHDLRLIDPLGREARRERAFCVLTSAEEIAKLHVEAPSEVRAGERFTVEVTAKDEDGEVVQDFAGEVELGAAAAVTVRLERGRGHAEARLERAGTVHLTARLTRDPTTAPCRPGTVQGVSGPVRVVPGAPAALRFTTPPREVRAEACSEALTVALVDASDNPTAAPEDLPLEVTLTSSTAQVSFDPGCAQESAGPGRIGRGESERSFHVQARQPGELMVSVTAPGGLEVTQPLRVTAGPAAALVFLSPSRAVRAGECSAEVRLGSEDAAGHAAPREAGVRVELIASPPTGFTFFEDEACARPVTEVLLPAGDAPVTFRFSSTLAGEPVIAASSAQLAAAQQRQKVHADRPAALAFTTAPSSIRTGACSPPFVIELLDGFGNPAIAPTPVEVHLPINAAGRRGAPADPFCTQISPSFTLNMGQPSATLFMRGVRPGTATITAEAIGLTPATHTLEVIAAPPCGNGVFDPGEQCDDGNTRGGDGCNALCLVEPGWVCARFPSRCFDDDDVSIVRPTACTNVDDVFCTLDAALRDDEPVIIVRPGTYAENLEIRNRTVEIVADDGAVLEPRSSKVLRLSGSADVRIHGLTLRGGGTDVIELNDNARLHLLEATVGPSPAHGVHTKNNSSVSIHRSRILSNTRGGLIFEGSGGFFVTSSVIAGNGGDGGVEIDHATNASALVNVTVADNATVGIRCDQATRVLNSILWGNGGSSVTGFSGSCMVRHSNLQGAHAEATNVSFPPRFTSSGTYHLQPTSPLLDRGDSVGPPLVPTEDIDGDPRPLGLGIDLGADEVR